MDKSKMKNVGMWIAILAQLIIILQVTGAVPQADIEIIDTVVKALLQILVFAGILSNPSIGKGFKG